MGSNTYHHIASYLQSKESQDASNLAEMSDQKCDTIAGAMLRNNSRSRLDVQREKLCYNRGTAFCVPLSSNSCPLLFFVSLSIPQFNAFY